MEIKDLAIAKELGAKAAEVRGGMGRGPLFDLDIFSAWKRVDVGNQSLIQATSQSAFAVNGNVNANTIARANGNNHSTVSIGGAQVVYAPENIFSQTSTTSAALTSTHSGSNG